MSGNCGNTTQNNGVKTIPGPKGPDGVSFLISTVVEPAGANCPYGGYKVTYGPDANKDNVIDTVIATWYLQNGAPGVSRAIQVTAIPISVTYPTGGWIITTGIDADNDGIPDTALNQSYVLNGAPGADGVTPTLIIGTVTTGAAGTGASANISPTATPNVYKIDLTIPQGNDGPAGTTSPDGLDLTGINIPTCAATELASATKTSEVINYLLQKICSMSSQTQGSPGQFAAFLANEFTGKIPTGAVYTPFPLFNDFQNGGFDNGGNWDGVNYVGPANGFTGKFTLSDLEFDVLVPPSSGNEIVQFALRKFDATQTTVLAVLCTMAVTVPTTASAGDNYTTVTSVSSNITVNPGEVVKLQIISTNSLDQGYYRIKSLSLTNVS